jgi:predicted enzyme related to lactoylglutathione lyase
MRTKSIELAWIVVKDFKKAVQFYTEVVGLRLTEMNEEWGWAELEGHDGEGMKLGIAQQCVKEEDPIQPGQNAVLTFTVDDLEKESQNLLKLGVKLIGPINEVPGHVKLQTVRDTEGNYFQLVEKISDVKYTTDEQMNSCCCH